jgi:hypothetical protein
MNDQPHTTLAGEPSMACPYGDEHGTPAEIVQHLQERHNEALASDRIAAYKVAARFANAGDSDTALRIHGAIDEMVIENVARSLSPISTPAGDLVPGSTVTVKVRVGGRTQTLRDYIVGRNGGSWGVFLRKGYTNRNIAKNDVLEIIG